MLKKLDSAEGCCLLEDNAVAETKDATVAFGAGNFVTCPAGLSCVWDIKGPVRKHHHVSG